MRNNVSEPFDRACAGHVFPERNVSSHFIIVGGLLRKNSMSRPSPLVFTMRPPCSVTFGSTSAARWARSRVSVPSSSVPMRRLKPATSAARIAVSRRSTRSPTKGLLRGGLVEAYHLWSSVSPCSCESEQRITSGHRRTLSLGRQWNQRSTRSRVAPSTPRILDRRGSG